MSSDWLRARLSTRLLTVFRSTLTARRGSPPGSPPSKRTPSSPDSSTSVIRSAVAISVLLGTQSVSTADPPMPSRSTTVTEAPSWAATNAAS
jgi:hypothetical protein